jgi:hypothetical protein
MICLIQHDQAFHWSLLLRWAPKTSLQPSTLCEVGEGLCALLGANRISPENVPYKQQERTLTLSWISCCKASKQAGTLLNSMFFSGKVGRGPQESSMYVPVPDEYRRAQEPQ